MRLVMSDYDNPRPKISPTRKWIGLGLLILLAAIGGGFLSGRIGDYVVTSGSMEPTLQIGDYLFVDSRRPVVPRRGDIIAFWNPEKPEERLVKRVVGMPSDEVRFEDGVFFLNGKAQYNEYYVTTQQIQDLPDQPTITLGVDEYYVLGDNRAYSFDSMNFGPVRSDAMIGIVKYIYWPRNRMGPVKNPNDEQN